MAEEKRTFTTAELMAQAQHSLDTLQPELATRFFKKALEQDPEDTTVMDALAEVLVGLGDPDTAKELFAKSTDLAPNAGPNKWLYLAQLQEGEEALQSFTKGIELLQVELEGRKAQNQVEDEEAEAIVNQLCSAHCSIAELYLTDLCYEENAESNCQSALDEAQKYDQSHSPEVTQALASLRISQVKGPEAAEYILETSRRLEMCNEDTMPSLEFRINTGKLLLECNDHDKECANKAVEILEDCKLEDDEVVEVWYLLGVAYSLCRPSDLHLARQHLERAKEMLEVVRKSVPSSEQLPFVEQLKLVDEQLECVGEAEKKKAEEGEVEEEEEEKDEEEDGEGEDMVS